MIPKFRAWYTPFGGSVKKFNKMEHGSAGRLLTHAEMSPDDYKLMQSTGLKDKNGVEIFEGIFVKQIIKGWVVVNDNWLDEGEIFLVKNDSKTVDYDNDDGRQLRILVSNALDKLGISDLHTEDDYESGISGKYIADNILMELFASDKRMKLDQIREYIVLDSMGLLEFQENWYGYSTWTIEGFNTETFALGGHDILEILENYKGKFVYLVIDKLQ